MSQVPERLPSFVASPAVIFVMSILNPETINIYLHPTENI